MSIYPISKLLRIDTKHKILLSLSFIFEIKGFIILKMYYCIKIKNECQHIISHKIFYVLYKLQLNSLCLLLSKYKLSGIHLENSKFLQQP